MRTELSAKAHAEMSIASTTTHHVLHMERRSGAAAAAGVHSAFRQRRRRPDAHVRLRHRPVGAVAAPAFPQVCLYMP